MDALREKAERLVDAKEHTDALFPMLGQPCGNAIDDAVEVCKAYLLEHPQDDEEPVTEEWLVSVGAKKTGMGGKCAFWLDEKGRDRCMVVEIGKGSSVVLLILIDGEKGKQPFYLLPETKTRGDVRRLCKALGVELP